MSLRLRPTGGRILKVGESVDSYTLSAVFLVLFLSIQKKYIVTQTAKFNLNPSSYHPKNPHYLDPLPQNRGVKMLFWSRGGLFVKSPYEIPKPFQKSNQFIFEQVLFKRPPERDPNYPMPRRAASFETRFTYGKAFPNLRVDLLKA